MKEKSFSKKIILLITMVLFFIYIFINFDDFKQIRIYNFWLFLPLLVSSVLLLITNGIVLREVVLPFGIKLSAKEWFGLSVITATGNLLTPFQGGTITRAFYLNSRHKLSYSNFLSALSGIYIIVFWLNSLVALISILLVNYFYAAFNWLVFITFLIIFLTLSFVIVFSPKIKRTFKLEILNKIVRVVNGWLVIKKNKRSVLFVALISFINVLLISVSSFLEFRAIGVEISFIKSLFVSIVSALSLFISLTPGSIGVREAFMAFTSNVVGVSSTKAITVSILDRIVSLIPLLFLAPVFSKKLFGVFSLGKKSNKH
ncbi:flippase-like domain-containing protein [Candidatus Shapirobacteria bacterium]|nr:flippase-like domain-containing protein [Candidatus Shapirobacteria bacterium]